MSTDKLQFSGNLSKRIDFAVKLPIIFYPDTEDNHHDASAQRFMKTADPELMRSINRFTVLDTIRRHGPISRVEISERSQLSTTTVSAITASLLDDGLILTRHEGDIRNAARGGDHGSCWC